MLKFKELNLTINEQYQALTIEINNHNFMIKNYLPVNQKLELISWIINKSADTLKFYNVGKLKIYRDLGLLIYYTNIQFDEDDLQDVAELYDKLYQSTILAEILLVLPEEETKWIDSVLMDTVDSIYKYQNSVMGILDTVTADYDNLNFDVAELQKNISNPENLKLLKDVVTNLG